MSACPKYTSNTVLYRNLGGGGAVRCGAGVRRGPHRAERGARGARPPWRRRQARLAHLAPFLFAPFPAARARARRARARRVRAVGVRGRARGRVGSMAAASLRGLCLAALAPHVACLADGTASAAAAGGEEEWGEGEGGWASDDGGRDGDRDGAPVGARTAPGTRHSTAADVHSPVACLPPELRAGLLAAARRLGALSRAPASVADAAVLALVAPGWEGVRSLDVSGLPLSDGGLERVLRAADGGARAAGVARVDIRGCANLSGNALGLLATVRGLREVRVGGGGGGSPNVAHDASVAGWLRRVASARRSALAEEVDSWEDRGCEDDASASEAGHLDGGGDEGCASPGSQWETLEKVVWVGAASLADASVAELAGVVVEATAEHPLDDGVARAVELPRSLARRARTFPGASSACWAALESPLAESLGARPVRHIAERFRRAYESRDLRLEPKRARNRRKAERAAHAEAHADFTAY